MTVRMQPRQPSRRPKFQAPKENGPPVGRFTGDFKRRVEVRFLGPFQKLAARPDAFDRVMTALFGKGYDRSAADSVRRDVAAGKLGWLPEPRGAAAQGVDPMGGYLDQVMAKLSARVRGGEVRPGDGLLLERLVSMDKPKETATVEQQPKVEKKKKKKKGGWLGGLKKIGGKIAGGIKGAVKGIGSAIKKAMPYIDMLSPLLLLVPGVGPALYAGYNIMKTAYYAANGDLKQAFFSGMAAMTGVGGVAGQVASYAQKGMQIYETAKGVMNGEVDDVIGAVSLAAGAAGGDVGAKIGKAAQAAQAGMAVKEGIETGNVAAVVGGVAGGAGAAADLEVIDADTAKEIQEIAVTAGKGAAVAEAMIKGEPVAALAGMSSLVSEFEGPLTEELGEERMKDLKEVLRHGEQGARAFEALRAGDPVAALSAFNTMMNDQSIDARILEPGVDAAQLGDAPNAEQQVALGEALRNGDIAGATAALERLVESDTGRAVRAGVEVARAIRGGDGDDMRLQSELLTSFAGVSLKSLMVDGDYAAWKSGMSENSPLGVRVDASLRSDSPERAFETLRQTAETVGREKSAQRVGLALALAETGFRAAQKLKAGDRQAAMRSMDFALALAGVTDQAALPSAQVASNDALRTAWDRELAGFDAGSDRWEDLVLRLADEARPRSR